MATYIRKLKDASGNYVSPAVRSTGVYLENNSTLSLLTFYPTGSIYQSFEDASPASLFGGEWEKLENTFLYGSGTKNVGDTGGEEEHVLTVSELAEHSHSMTYVIRSTSNTTVGSGTKAALYGENATNKTNSSGENQPHNNMPPYTVINIWKRVA